MIIWLGCSSCVLLITSLGLTADLIGPHVQSGALIYGLMSLTDKLSNGLAVLVIQGQIPCLTTFEILWLPLVKVAELLPNGCTETEPCTQPPVPVTSTMTPDFGGDICFSFYKTVLTIATSSTSIFGAIFVIIMFALSRYRKQREERSEMKPVCWIWICRYRLFRMCKMNTFTKDIFYWNDKMTQNYLSFKARESLWGRVFLVMYCIVQ